MKCQIKLSRWRTLLYNISMLCLRLLARFQRGFARSNALDGRIKLRPGSPVRVKSRGSRSSVLSDYGRTSRASFWHHSNGTVTRKREIITPEIYIPLRKDVFFIFPYSHTVLWVVSQASLIALRSYEFIDFFISCSTVPTIFARNT